MLAGRVHALSYEEVQKDSTLSGSGPAKTRPKVGALDGVLVGVGTVALALLLVLQGIVAPTFASMFRDFGGELPALTRLALGWSLAGVGGALWLACTAAGTALLLAGHRTAGRTALTAAVLLTFAASGVLLVALYLPVFQLAGAVAP